MKLFAGSVLIMILVGCASPAHQNHGETNPGFGERVPDPMFGLGDRKSFGVSSEIIGRDFHILVRLPRSYGSSDRDYPLIVLLDGGLLFPMLAPYQLMMEAEGTADEVLMVGISYGGLGFSNGNFRSTDFTAPSPHVEYFGGAEAYQAFLLKELLPQLMERYRINPSQRVLLGQSLGGQFAMHAALTEPQLFSTFVAVNPAIHANKDYFLSLAAEAAETERTLLLAIGSEDSPVYRDALAEWLEGRSPDSIPGFNLRVLNLPDAYHATSAPAAYHAVIRSLFPSPSDQ
jgi:predicted alpha/beta superfamily hydrolase